MSPPDTLPLVGPTATWRDIRTLLDDAGRDCVDTVLAEHAATDTVLDVPVLDTEDLPPSPPWAFALAGCIDTLTATAMLTTDARDSLESFDAADASCMVAYSTELHEVAPYFTVMRSSDPVTDDSLDALLGLYDSCLAPTMVRNLAQSLGAEPDEATIACLLGPARSLVIGSMRDAGPDDSRAILTAAYTCVPAAFRTFTFTEISGYEPRPVERACLALRLPDPLVAAALAGDASGAGFARDIAACSLGAGLGAACEPRLRSGGRPSRRRGPAARRRRPPARAGR